LSLHSPDGHSEVQAAHIYPKAKKGSDDLRNGICLCRLHHWAFDVGWFSLLDDLSLILRPSLPTSDDFSSIRQLPATALRAPSDHRFRPHRLFLREHRRLHGFE